MTKSLSGLTFYDTGQPPPFGPAQRPGLYDLHGVPHPGGIGLVVGGKPGPAAYVFLVCGVLDQTVDHHDYGLIHFVGNDLADHPFSVAPCFHFD